MSENENVGFFLPKRRRIVGIVIAVVVVGLGLYGMYWSGESKALVKVSTLEAAATADRVEAAAQQTLAAEDLAAAALEALPTYTPLPTHIPQPTFTPPPTVNPDEVFTGSLPNFCMVTDTTQEDIDGEMLPHEGSFYQNSAIGLADCAAAFEGRWYEGYPPPDDHHITAFFGAAENVSVYQGSQWIMPVGTKPREIVYGLGLGKCDNWDDAQVGYLPILLDYVDQDTMEITHLRTSCEELRSDNPLPEEIGLIPGKFLPHFRLGYTWNGDVGPTGVVDTKSTFTGNSQFDTENRGMACSAKSNTFGDNMIGAIDSSWDGQCIYLLDGKINSRRGIGLVRGVDIEEASATFDASVWPVPAGWVATKWASQFANDNCPAELPTQIYADGAWTEYEVHSCP